MLNRWNGETVCIAASGPSLESADVWEAYDAGCKVITINETWRACPAAHALYAADYMWWIKRGPGPAAFVGERWTTSAQWPINQAELLASLNKVETKAGCDLTDAPPICTGNNSSFQAMSLAVLWGAKRIIFTGLDLSLGPNGKDHWHGAHDGLASPVRALPVFLKAFEHVAPQLTARGVQVINASRQTALTCFPRMSMIHALS